MKEYTSLTDWQKDSHMQCSTTKRLRQAQYFYLFGFNSVLLSAGEFEELTTCECLLNQWW